MHEVLFLVGKSNVILWSDASNSPVSLPDSRARWEAIWSRRDLIVEIAHSHPKGPLAFSHEDGTTMAALVTALGRRLRFSVVAPAGMVRADVKAVTAGRAPAVPVATLVREEPWWAPLLRLASGMNERTPLQEK